MVAKCVGNWRARSQDREVGGVTKDESAYCASAVENGQAEGWRVCRISEPNRGIGHWAGISLLHPEDIYRKAMGRNQ